MRWWTVIGATTLGTALLGAVIARSALQTPQVRSVEEKVLREYCGVYQWEPNAFVYLQLWKEFSGFDKPSQLVAFDESGEEFGQAGLVAAMRRHRELAPAEMTSAILSDVQTFSGGEKHDDITLMVARCTA